MNVAAMHKHLEDLGYDVESVSANGSVTFRTPKSDAERGKIKKDMLAFREPSREEKVAELLANRDALIDQLILERFMPQEAR